MNKSRPLESRKWRPPSLISEPPTTLALPLFGFPSSGAFPLGKLQPFELPQGGPLPDLNIDFNPHPLTRNLHNSHQVLDLLDGLGHSFPLVPQVADLPLDRFVELPIVHGLVLLELLADIVLIPEILTLLADFLYALLQPPRDLMVQLELLQLPVQGHELAEVLGGAQAVQRV